MNIFNKLKAYLTYREAVALADAKHQSERGRFYVLASEDMKLVVLDKYDLKKLKKYKYIRKDCHMIDLINESFYYTPTFNGDCPLSEEKKEQKYRAYLKWYDVSLKVERLKRKQMRKSAK